MLTIRRWHRTWQALVMLHWQWAAVEALLALMVPDKSVTAVGLWLQVKASVKGGPGRQPVAARDPTQTRILCPGLLVL